MLSLIKIFFLLRDLCIGIYLIYKKLKEILENNILGNLIKIESNLISEFLNKKIFLELNLKNQIILTDYLTRN